MVYTKLVKKKVNMPVSYTHIDVYKRQDKDSKAIKALTEALNSKEVKEFINEKYSGSIVPAF